MNKGFTTEFHRVIHRVSQRKRIFNNATIQWCTSATLSVNNGAIRKYATRHTHNEDHTPIGVIYW